MQLGNITIKNTAEGVVDIDIEGVIGVPEWWQFESPSERVSTYEKFKNKVESIKSIRANIVNVNIASPGGSVNDALLIYEALTSLDAATATICRGYCASAATIVAQAGKVRRMSPNSLYLIHQSMSTASGNKSELAAVHDLLEHTDERIANIYASRSGRPAEEFVALMAENNGSGRWLSPQEALDAGLIDEVERDAWTGNMKNIVNLADVKAFGLPALPQNIEQMDEKKTIVQRVLDWFGLSDDAEKKQFEEAAAKKIEEVEALNAKYDAAVRDVADRDERLAKMGEEMENLKKQVVDLTAQLQEARAMAIKPTEPKQPVQDPPVDGELTGNAKAYAEDAKNFRF